MGATQPKTTQTLCLTNQNKQQMSLQENKQFRLVRHKSCIAFCSIITIYKQCLTHSDTNSFTNLSEGLHKVCVILFY